MSRRICVVTGSRAEYGLLRWTMEALRADPRVTLLVAATGMHLSVEFGTTAKAIEEDGFRIDAKVDMLLASDDPRAIAKSVGLGVIGFADAYATLAPDLVVLLGDRFEILAAAQAALLMKIPIAHLHGGEISEGAIDDAIRHAITKMASLHFVAALDYRQRVLQLGEEPARVFAVGAPGLDALSSLALLDREALEARVGIKLRSPSLLVTYHPATLGADPILAAKTVLRALERFDHGSVIVTKPNADAAGREIAALIDAWAAPRREHVAVHTSLGQLGYLSAMRHVDVVVGNSSSGLIEAPAMRVPTVNIGPRQDGRLKAASVIDCDEIEQEIVQAIERARSVAHREATKTMRPPYGTGGGVSKAIAENLATVPLEGLARKHFYDLPESRSGSGASGASGARGKA